LQSKLLESLSKKSVKRDKSMLSGHIFFRRQFNFMTLPRRGKVCRTEVNAVAGITKRRGLSRAALGKCLVSGARQHLGNALAGVAVAVRVDGTFHLCIFGWFSKSSITAS
jgi:hypothetical protein